MYDEWSSTTRHQQKNIGMRTRGSEIEYERTGDKRYSVVGELLVL
jgi:hypothetical protein